MLDEARSFLGQQWIGTNESDSGECAGFFNRVVVNATGCLYPIQGAQGATDILYADNTRPDLFTQVINDPNDPNLLPEPGDWVIWDRTWGNSYGHIACVEDRSTVAFTSIEQNYSPHTVTRQWHDWSHIAGWIHYQAPVQNEPPLPAPEPQSEPTPPPAPEPAPVEPPYIPPTPTPAPDPIPMTPPEPVVPPATEPPIVEPPIVEKPDDTASNSSQTLWQWLVVLLSKVKEFLAQWKK